MTLTDSISKFFFNAKYIGFNTKIFLAEWIDSGWYKWWAHTSGIFQAAISNIKEVFFSIETHVTHTITKVMVPTIVGCVNYMTFLRNGLQDDLVIPQWLRILRYYTKNGLYSIHQKLTKMCTPSSFLKKLYYSHTLKYRDCLRIPVWIVLPALFFCPQECNIGTPYKDFCHFRICSNHWSHIHIQQC